MTSWQKFEISPDYTHHLLEQKPAYSARFLSVLKFHKPGLAPVRDATGSFHIDGSGEHAYISRFLKTFGFYDNLAAVATPAGWCHILPDGSALYQERFAWCGNFQEGRCAVKSFDGSFFHIDREGQRAYAQTFHYVGDFHDGYAVVQNKEGLHTHIDLQGNLLHGKWFIDLDVYHKGFARAKDRKGWFHIDFQAAANYAQRYKAAEPFYNGIARVETPLGALHLITEKGETMQGLRGDLEDEFHQVSAELVSYWRFYTLQTASELELFDHLPIPADDLSKQIALPEKSTLKLLCALQEMGFVENRDDQSWACTSKGAFLRSDHPYSLKNACRLWKEEHLVCWRNLLESLKTETPAFNQLFGKGCFDWLKDHPEKNHLYHAALSIYAQRDYLAFCTSVDFNSHHSVVDVGGSTGALLSQILTLNPHLRGTLLDLPHVIQLVNIPSQLKNRMECLPVDFFETWPSLSVESAVLSRVLHDWPDEEALKILKGVHSILSGNPNNRLYLIENIQEEGSAQGALLNLNMLVMTGGVERSLKQFEDLLKRAGFILEKKLPLNEVSSILIAKKREI